MAINTENNNMIYNMNELSQNEHTISVNRCILETAMLR